MQRLVGIRRVEALLDQAACQHLGGVTVASQLIGLVGLAPDIVARRREGELVVGADAVRRDDVLAKVLVLVVAPYQDEVRVERIERGPGLLHPADQIGTMPGRRRGALVVTPFGAHRLGPALRCPEVRRQIGVLHHAPENTGHPIIVPGQRRIMRYAQCQNFCHRFLACCWCGRGRPSPDGQPRDRGQPIYRRSAAHLARRRVACVAPGLTGTRLSRALRNAVSDVHVGRIASGRWTGPFRRPCPWRCSDPGAILEDLPERRDMRAGEQAGRHKWIRGCEFFRGRAIRHVDDQD